MPGNCHSVKRLYYCKTGTTLALGIKELKYDKDVEDMLNDGYDNGNMIDLFVEHYDYDTETEADDSVVIKDITTSDPFLNKLRSTRALFRGSRQQKVPDIYDIEEDLDNDHIDHLHKVKKGVVYPAFDPNIPWDKMEPVLGRYEMHMSILWKECCRRQMTSTKVNENRNYNLGSLVNLKWIAAQYGKEIIGDTFIPYRKMKDDIRVKYLIDVSLGQCKRAKQRALYDHEGGLIEHYNRLYDYRQAILDSNPGSTCRLDVFESDGSPYFKRMYICFKSVKDGRLAGCRKKMPRIGVGLWQLLQDDLAFKMVQALQSYQFLHKGHNKASCKNETRPKPGIKKPPSRKRQPVTGETASRGGLGSRGGLKGGSGGRGKGGGNSSRDGGNSNVIEETHEAIDDGKAVDKGKVVSEVPHDTTEQAKVDKGKAVDD
ncbi:hypothetical protein Tco_0882057, partial [Tanacetum coccineum]